MPTNIEIKAIARDPQRQEQLAAALATAPLVILDQADTFFKAGNGRLKLRQFAPDHGELIHYHRANIAGPKASLYSIAKTADPAALRQVLSDALGVLGEVRKRRKLYLAGQTRIHLDEVAGLGSFIELEVVLQPGQRHEEGEKIAQEIMRHLQIEPGDLIDRAYLDMLLARAQR